MDMAAPAERHAAAGAPELLPAVPVTINGEPREVPAGSTLADLLRALELDPRLVVVEHNRVILRDRERYTSLPLAAGDTLEIVHFVGGG